MTNFSNFESVQLRINVTKSIMTRTVLYWIKYSNIPLLVKHLYKFEMNIKVKKLTFAWGQSDQIII